ncbi:hypothetical protein VSK92_21150 [Bacillus swezeyi]|uniref:hypothetical protein n=1 Tax=Bacillus swezeyi TaxID=1925020 RepID=UPI0039C75A6F
MNCMASSAVTSRVNVIKKLAASLSLAVILRPANFSPKAEAAKSLKPNTHNSQPGQYCLMKSFPAGRKMDQHSLLQQRTA